MHCRNIKLFAIAALAPAITASSALAQTPVWYNTPQDVPYVPIPENVPALVTKPMPAKLNNGPAFSEGELIPNAQGTFTADASGNPEFIFTKPEPNKPNSILLLPSLALQELQMANRPGRLFSISGQVTIYQGQAYLLMNPEVDIASPASTTQPATPLIPINPNSPEEENPQKILANLISHHMTEPLETSGAVPIPAKTVAPDVPVAQGKKSQNWAAIPEGQYIWDQFGRLIHDPATGEWLFAFRSDGQSMESPPIILLPSHLLQTIQSEDGDDGTQTAFIVSGLVTECDGRNYLFLTNVEEYYNLDRF
ncbi:MAG TPA: hypothetical protein VMG59_02400 [Phycisphaerae bacterium]|nr:hypothetical protein [Phycisphaerae bacterium]